jgi:hypothetical protein
MPAKRNRARNPEAGDPDVAQAYLIEHGLEQAWALHEEDNRDNKGNGIIVDIVDNLIKWGRLTDPQLNFLKKLVNEIDQRYVQDAKKQAEIDAAAPVPEVPGRVVITAKVLSLKSVTSQYGTTWKMLVQHEDGWKAWGSVPLPVLADIKIGDQVEFTASLKASDTDAKFGFFSRPKKLKFLNDMESMEEDVEPTAMAESPRFSPYNDMIPF